MFRNSFVEIPVSNLFIIRWICKFAFVSSTINVFRMNSRGNLVCSYCTSSTNSFWVIIAFSPCLSAFKFIQIYWTRCWMRMNIEQSLKKVSRICNTSGFKFQTIGSLYNVGVISSDIPAYMKMSSCTIWISVFVFIVNMISQIIQIL